jgi:hypothetical protein
LSINRLLKIATKGTVRAMLYFGGLGAAAVATVVIVFAVQARVRLPDLQPWHRIELTEEFRAGRAGAPKTFAEYLALEDRLFAEVRKRVLDNPAVAPSDPVSRYNPKSVPAQLALGEPYNRSYELVPKEVRGAVLLVHGLSDSPYSMRSLAELFLERGFYVLVLRLPGHGTVPAGFLDVRWEDWYAAVELAAQHATQRAGGKPSTPAATRPARRCLRCFRCAASRTRRCRGRSAFSSCLRRSASRVSPRSRPVDDPVYGLAPKASGPLVWTIGDFAVRGEPGAILVPLGTLSRLRSNPFFDVVRKKIGAAIDADLAR